jgi:hypothetical protein
MLRRPGEIGSVSGGQRVSIRRGGVLQAAMLGDRGDIREAEPNAIPSPAPPIFGQVIWSSDEGQLLGMGTSKTIRLFLDGSEE